MALNQLKQNTDSELISENDLSTFEVSTDASIDVRGNLVLNRFNRIRLKQTLQASTI